MRKTRNFFERRIGSLTFSGVLVAGGPYVTTGSEAAELSSGIRIAQLPSGGFLGGPKTARPHAWWIVREDFFPLVNLKDLSAEDRTLVSTEFGIPFYGEATEGEVFDSPAFAALVSWTLSNPEEALKMSRWVSHLPGWYARAVRVGALG
jgi:hypothetical protein